MPISLLLLVQVRRPEHVDIGKPDWAGTPATEEERTRGLRLGEGQEKEKDKSPRNPIQDNRENTNKKVLNNIVVSKSPAAITMKNPTTGKTVTLTKEQIAAAAPGEGLHYGQIKQIRRASALDDVVEWLQNLVKSLFGQ